ncbi:stage III sporulation protein SpoIIIAB [Cohnella yongneupensis]|uniref:Stage III sporulation protein SpoIIIAB n=1 Tax=Cohnella yongneupensis TaxID=425006 RepID=A0ABW0R5Z6_9BACL
MLKFIGVALILFAGTMIGFVQAARYAARPKQIRQLLHALQRLETEISYGQTPLPQALDRIAGAVPPPLSYLFKDIAGSLQTETAHSGVTVKEIWGRAIVARWPETAMRAPEQEALIRFGSTLGASGREDQLKHIRLAMHQLQAEEANARDDQQKYERLSRSLGALGAALIVILIV